MRVVIGSDHAPSRRRPSHGGEERHQRRLDEIRTLERRTGTPG